MILRFITRPSRPTGSFALSLEDFIMYITLIVILTAHHTSTAPFPQRELEHTVHSNGPVTSTCLHLQLTLWAVAKVNYWQVSLMVRYDSSTLSLKDPPYSVLYLTCSFLYCWQLKLSIPGLEHKIGYKKTPTWSILTSSFRGITNLNYSGFVSLFIKQNGA